MHPRPFGFVAIGGLALALSAASLAAEAGGGIERARELVRQQRLEEALERYDEVLAVAPADPGARLERGRVLGWLGRHEEALGEIDSVLEVDPSAVDARLDRARLLGWMRRYAEAEEEVARVLEARPGDVSARLVRGDLHAWQGRTERAAEVYASILEEVPGDPETWTRLGRVRTWQGRGQEARAAYEEALRISPDHRGAREALRRLERAAPARYRLDAGLRFDDLSGPRSSWWHEHVQLSFRPTENASLHASVDQYRRFDDDDTQLSLGGATALSGGWSMDGQVTLGIDTDVVARSAFELGVARSLGERWTTGLRYRRSHYPGSVDTDTVVPSLDVSPSDDWNLGLRYYLTRIPGGRLGHAGLLRLELFPQRRLSPSLGVAYGSEAFDTASAQQLDDRIRIFSASAGLRWLASDRVGIRLDFEYEDREDGYRRRGVGSSVFVAF